MRALYMGNKPTSLPLFFLSPDHSQLPSPIVFFGDVSPSLVVLSPSCLSFSTSSFFLFLLLSPFLSLSTSIYLSLIQTTLAWSPASGHLTVTQAISGCQSIPLGLLVIMIPSVHNDSAWIISTLFCTETTYFANWSEPNRALFWGNDPEFFLVEKMLSNGI